MTAPAPARIIEKGLVSDRVVIDTVIAKYCDHLPLYRQSVMLERETGLEISRATLDGWVMTVGTTADSAHGRDAQSSCWAADTFRRMKRRWMCKCTTAGESNHQAYLWQYGRPGGSVVFEFQMGRGRAGPKQFLEGFEGLLQTDGYIAYEKVGGPQVVRLGCWAR